MNTRNFLRNGTELTTFLRTMSLTKRDIACAIHDSDAHISIAEAVSLVDGIFTAIKDCLARGEKVMITNFGTFQVVSRAARQGINPATGGGLVVEGHRAVSFRPSPGLQGLLNQPVDAVDVEDAEDADLDPAGDR